MTRLALLTLVVVASLTFSLLAAEPPAPPAVSTFAPADLLGAQLGEYAKSFATALADANAYSEAADRLKRDANTAIVVATALGLHDQPGPAAQAAPAVAAAAAALAKAKDYDAAKAAFADFQSALGGAKTDGPPLNWQKRASLGQLMKQVTFLNNRLKRGARPGPRFKDNAAENAQLAAVLAVIGQATVFDTHEVKDPALIDQWYAQSAAMRDAAGQLSRSFAAQDAAAAANGLKQLEQSCNDCHKTFRVETTE